MPLDTVILIVSLAVVAVFVVVSLARLVGLALPEKRQPPSYYRLPVRDPNRRR